MAKTSNDNLVCNAVHLLAKSNNINMSNIQWVGPIKQRYDPSIFKLTYWIFLEQVNSPIFVDVWRIALMYLRFNDMFLLILMSKSFNEILLHNRQFQKYLKLSNAIISCDFVHDIYSHYIEVLLCDDLLFFKWFFT